MYERSLAEALKRLESACGARAALLSPEAYKAAIQIEGMKECLDELEAARMNALQVLRAVDKVGPMTLAARDVLAERWRQINSEGWTPEHDDAHAPGDLARAAAAYAAHAGGAGLIGHLWPWDKGWWKPSTERRDMVKACALGLAAIESMDRAEAAQPAGSPAGEGGEA